MVVMMKGKVSFHRRTQSITILQKPILEDYSKSYGTFITTFVVEGGTEREMNDSELKAHSQKLKELTLKIQAYLESARRSVISELPRMDRNISQIK